MLLVIDIRSLVARLTLPEFYLRAFLTSPHLPTVILAEQWQIEQELGKRLARFLLLEGVNGKILHNQSEIAHHIGASREAVNRKLERWRRPVAGCFADEDRERIVGDAQLLTQRRQERAVAGELGA